MVSTRPPASLSKLRHKAAQWHGVEKSITEPFPLAFRGNVRCPIKAIALICSCRGGHKRKFRSSPQRRSYYYGSFALQVRISTAN